LAGDYVVRNLSRLDLASKYVLVPGMKREDLLRTLLRLFQRFNVTWKLSSFRIGRNFSFLAAMVNQLLYIVAPHIISISI
jgi:hypothetical protein